MQGVRGERELRMVCANPGSGLERDLHSSPNVNLPHTLLVPTDFSESSGLALELAVGLATKLDAKVHLVNVLGLQALQFPDVGAPLTTEIIDHLVEGNTTALARLVDKYRGSGVIGEVVFRTGDPRDVIDTVARELHADLIVMGSHGRHGCERALLGTVAESILRTAPCPVLIARPTFTADAATRGIPSRDMRAHVA